jgi:hypothetical protein
MFNNIIHRKLRKKCNAITAVQHFAFPSSMRPEVAGNKSGKGSRATTLGSPPVSPGLGGFCKPG